MVQTVDRTTLKRVFISYKRNVEPDEPLAQYFFRLLRELGHEVFIDSEIAIGEKWPAVIRQKLEEADFVIVLLSEQEINSEMIIEEVAIADRLKKQRDIPVILPIRIGYNGDLPYDLGARLDRIQHAMWVAQGDEVGIGEQLREALAQRRGFTGVARASQSEAATLLATDGNQVDTDTPLASPRPTFDPRAIEALESPQGAMRLGSRYYIERQVDRQTRDLIRRDGVTVRVKGGGQTGKSSLLARLYQHARDHNLRAVYIDFQLLDDRHLRDLESLLRYFADLLAIRLKTNQSPDVYWQTPLGSKDRLTDFLAQEILMHTQSPLVLLMDKVDRLFLFDQYRNDFFSLIRSWHNYRAFDPLWERANLVLSYSTEAFLFITDINQSPFNVGDDFELIDFDRAQVEELNQRHGGPVKTSQQMTDFIDLLGGHPFLVRKALHELVARNLPVDQLVQRAYDDDGPFGDHLQRYLLHFDKSPDLRAAMKSVIHTNVCSTDQLFYQLRAAGLVRGPNRSEVRPRCGLYAEYFRRHL